MSPGQVVLAPARWNHSQQAVNIPQTIDDAIKAARADERTAHLGHRKVCRLVRQYMVGRQRQQSFSDWISLGYADPTGDAAVRNVLRGGVSG